MIKGHSLITKHPARADASVRRFFLPFVKFFETPSRNFATSCNGVNSPEDAPKK
ncbi:hypothetical protein [Shigella boydii]|uniref:hypothetical protein n=1 Tax=Shigella boydii TaxID=621 RepID=UPI001478517A|nr:hypothetical protein [Shigella boydii]